MDEIELASAKRRKLISYFKDIDLPFFVSDPKCYKNLFLNPSLKRILAEPPPFPAFGIFMPGPPPAPFCATSHKKERSNLNPAQGLVSELKQTVQNLTNFFVSNFLRQKQELGPWEKGRNGMALPAINLLLMY